MSKGTLYIWTSTRPAPVSSTQYSAQGCTVTSSPAPGAWRNTLPTLPSEADDAVHRTPRHVGQDRIKGIEVSMNVGDQRDPHGPRLRLLSAREEAGQGWATA